MKIKFQYLKILELLKLPLKKRFQNYFILMNCKIAISFKTTFINIIIEINSNEGSNERLKPYYLKYLTFAHYSHHNLMKTTLTN